MNKRRHWNNHEWKRDIQTNIEWSKMKGKYIEIYLVHTMYPQTIMESIYALANTKK